ncbi:hypothetical protein LWF01_07155 [Saxibacter everestensis]|uniref:Uncharacterized protein n=1 Tax=Saxibacter everestensis TaxID=2909229 RepID=A0ABY8QZ94_9MICO|nr:hypothetical protein LWF01_07155 [Brevibacteriaceae bacterium ZFBP1038]
MGDDDSRPSHGALEQRWGIAGGVGLTVGAGVCLAAWQIGGILGGYSYASLSGALAVLGFADELSVAGPEAESVVLAGDGDVVAVDPVVVEDAE